MPEPSETQIGRYRSALIKLLPPGDGIAKWFESNVYRLLEGIAVEFARVHDRALDLLDEADPSTASELLSEWEEVVGLPDECTPAETEADRQALVVARLRGIGGHAPSDYEAVAEALLGDDLVSLDYERYAPFICTSDCTDSLYQAEWAHTVTVLIEHSGDGPVERLECEFNRRKRAHAEFLYRWTHPDGLLDVDGSTLLDIDGSYLLDVT